MRTSPANRPGFAMVTAIMLLSLAAITVTLLGVTITNQVRRTEMAAEDAQLRQLLSAGAAVAQTRVASNSSGRFSISLPDALKQLSAELTVDIHDVSPAQKIAEVDASLDNHHRSQRLTFALQNGAWQISRADLGM
jgi:hypothetical protein